jgi:hypothetical protein
VQQAVVRAPSLSFPSANAFFTFGTVTVFGSRMKFAIVSGSVSVAGGFDMRNTSSG